MADANAGKLSDALAALHAEAEAMVRTFRYIKPAEINAAVGRVNLARGKHVRGVVQVVKKGAGEPDLHYHTSSDSFWMVLRGRARFYGPGDKLIGELGEGDGTVTPAYSRYWFENCGETDLEILQVSAFHDRANTDTGRTYLNGKEAIVRSQVFEADKV